MERLFHDLGGMLRLTAVTDEALLGFEVATLSGFGVSFLIGCGPGHAVPLLLLEPRGTLEG